MEHQLKSVGTSALAASMSGPGLAAGKRTQVDSASLPGLVGRQRSQFAARPDAVAPTPQSSSSPGEAFGSRIGASSSPPLANRRTRAAVVNKTRGDLVFTITITHAMTDAEFRAAASRQLFGGRDFGLTWKSTSSTRDTWPKGKHDVAIEAAYYYELRAAAGFAPRSDGREDERAAALEQGDKGSRDAVNRETDRRFRELTGRGGSIGKGDAESAALWKKLRDELLRKIEYLRDLPEHVKKLIEFERGAAPPAPETIDKLYEIAKKLERLTPEEVEEYLRRASKKTRDLGEFERSVDSFFEEAARRRDSARQRDEVTARLVGLEEAYQLYRELLGSAGLRAAFPVAAEIERAILGMMGVEHPLEAKANQLVESLKAHGFSTVREFVDYIERFVAGYQARSAEMVTSSLKVYVAELHRARGRYQSDEALAELNTKLATLKPAVSTLAATDSEIRALEGRRTVINGPHINKKPKSARQREAERERASQRADLDVSLGGIDPILADGRLSDDRQIDKKQLTSAGAGQLRGILEAKIAGGLEDAGEALGLIASSPEVIFDMKPEIQRRFRMDQGIAPGSIFAMILSDVETLRTVTKIAKAVLLTVIAIALSIASGGSGLGLLAAIGMVGLSAVDVYTEVGDYNRAKTLSDVGLANEPSAAWMVLAIVDLGLEAAVLRKVLQALSKSTRAFNETDDVEELVRAVTELERRGVIDSKVADQAIAAAKKKATREATTTGKPVIRKASEATLELRAKFRAKYPSGTATAWRGVRLPPGVDFKGTLGGNGTMVILEGGQNAALHYALVPTKNKFVPSDKDSIFLLQMKIRADDIIAYPQMEALEHVMLAPHVDLTTLPSFDKRVLTVKEARALYGR